MATVVHDPPPDWWGEVRVRNVGDCTDCGKTDVLSKKRKCRVCTARDRRN